MNIQHKTFSTVIKKVDDNENIITVVGSQMIKDRDNEIVDLKSMNLKFYKDNPAFIWSHRPAETPENVLGHAKKVWTEDDKLMFKLEFLPENVNPRADMVRKMYQVGALKAFSIGFRITSPDDVEFDDKKKVTILKNAELFEISACVIPANPRALIQSKEMKDALHKGIIDQAEITDFELYLKELGFNQEPDLIQETEHINKDEIDIDVIIKEIDSKIKETPSYLDSILSDLFDSVSVTETQDTEDKQKGDELDKILDEFLEVKQNG